MFHNLVVDTIEVSHFRERIDMEGALGAVFLNESICFIFLSLKLYKYCRKSRFQPRPHKLRTRITVLWYMPNTSNLQ